MIISKRKAFIFAAFNKTGTTSIEKVLRRFNSPLLHAYLAWRYRREYKNKSLFKHIRPLDLKRMLGDEEWDRYFSFSFVRNPWSRAVSLYNSHRKEPTGRKWALAQGSFEEWVRGGGTGTAKKSMTEFISDDNGRVIVDFVGKYENLDGDFKSACKLAGLPTVELPHLNRSTSGDYRRLYTDETRDTVAEWCRRDIEKFGYDF